MAAEIRRPYFFLPETKWRLFRIKATRTNNMKSLSEKNNQFGE
jgi:hypothetical protein